MYQYSPPLSHREVLPTMYDLPSEDPEEPGLPDEFHLLQPELLRLTFRPPTYQEEEIFTASDLNLYYDPRHPQWYKRPDWFAVLGVSRLYDGKDLRLSYVTWQEGIYPFMDSPKDEEVRQWIIKSQRDIKGARILIENELSLLDAVVYHC